MAANLLNKHRSWITDYLLPKLIEQQKLITCKNAEQHAKIKSIDVKPMSLDNTFMLTYCYFVKISIDIQQAHFECEDSANGPGEKEWDFVIKVVSAIEIYRCTISES